LPDISKINALAIGSVAKVDGLTKASILDIDGVAVPALAPPLDTYTSAAAAYSVRLLRTAYTGDIMRVRRASDNVEADVGFDGSNELSLTSPISNTSDAQSYTDLADFVDHTGTPTDAFCRYWYDQSGNSNDAGQSTAGSQPKVYDATTGLIEEGSAGNEKPALDFDGSNDNLRMSFASNQSQPNTYALVATTDTTASTQVFFSGHTSGTARNQMDLTAVGAIQMYAGASDGTVSADTNQNLYFLLYNSTSSIYYINNTTNSGTLSVGTYAQDGLTIGARYTQTVPFNGTIQEFIMWNTNQTSPTDNRTGIENNLNGFFSIY